MKSKTAWFFLLAIMWPATAPASPWDQTWWHPHSGDQLEIHEAAAHLAQAHFIVIGEQHNHPPTHRAQANVLNMLAKQSAYPLTLGWEFLNIEDENAIKRSYERFQAGHLTTPEFITNLFPDAAGMELYAPMLEALRDNGSRLGATNLSRQQKRPIVRHGLDAVAPQLIPDGFAEGGPLYYERFAEAMSNHPLPYPIENYFSAQSLTDDVMAVSMVATTKNPGKKVLITGAFHGDYRDGVVQRLEIRAPFISTLYLKIVDATQRSPTELQEMFFDSRYGPIADLVFVSGEPRQDETQ
jgi:uncharacterized iron-regulated protein